MTQMAKYTKGQEFMLQSGKQYKGFYHTIKDKFYTGMKHVHGVSKRIHPISRKNARFTQQGLKYKNLIEQLQRQKQIIQLRLAPNHLQEDFKDSYTIYILKKISTGKIYQVTKQCFQQLNSSEQFKAFFVRRRRGDQLKDVVHNYNELKKVNDRDVQKYLTTMRGF